MTTQPRENARATARRKFISALLAQRFRPGQLMSQREIAEITQTSLASVREALKILETEGIVQLIPQKGVAIREMGRKDIQDAYQLRLMIELQAIEPYVQNVPDAELSALRAQTRALMNAPAVEPALAFERRVVLDHEIHRNIVSALDNALIAHVHRNTESIMMLSRLNLPVNFYNAGPAMQEHLDMLDHIANRDINAARQALQDHLIGSCMRAVAAAH